MTKDMAAIVAAATISRGIGYEGQLPWKLPADMRHFKQVTTADVPYPGAVNAVVMGRKTWQSIPRKFRPLQDRINVVLSRSTSAADEEKNDNAPVLWAKSWDDAVEQLAAMEKLGNVYVIGGAEIYQQAIAKGLVKKIIYTEIGNLPESTKMDSFFPDLPEAEWTLAPYQLENRASAPLGDETNKENTSTTTAGGEAALVADGDSIMAKKPKSTNSLDFVTDSSSGLSYRFLQYTKRNTEELQYLRMCEDILNKGVKRGDRTGTGTLSIFGTQMRFSLRDGRLPLLTTKRTFWRGVAEELLWFISGNTNANELAEKNIHIWDGNGSREFLDNLGLSHREAGDLGPVYGFQWRHFGAKYVDMHADYKGQGVDQLAECIDKIKNNPEDRRIIMSAWNPADLELMALPPCHMFCQFYVDTEKNELSCQMYQRSADMGLGVPFNIASYALLTHMIAHVTGRKPGDFVHTIGDAHIYLNHVEALKEQLKREPREFPTLKINPEKANIDDFVYDDFEVLGYNPHKPIKMKMAV